MLRVFIVTCLMLGLASQSVARQIRHLKLNNGWEFRQEGKEKWYPAKVPGTVHTDLLRNKLIPDPFTGNNAEELSWIEESNWEYRLRFDIAPKYLRYEHIDFVLEGLDTYAEVYLNGEQLLRSANMFRRFQGNVRSALKEGQNEVRVVFQSPLRRAASLKMQYPYQLPAGNDASETKVSPFVRKAPYQFGWDWAPRMVTSGIWKPVYIRLWEDVRVQRVQVISEDISEERAVVRGNVWVDGRKGRKGPAELKIAVDGREMFADTFRLSGTSTRVDFEMVIEDPKLWWPQGYGEQHLYEMEVMVGRGGTKKDSSIVQVGLREVELVQEEDKDGKSFYFKVNGEPIYVRGGNFVPTDMFLPRGREAEARVLREMKAAHFNMVRVWAGGGYASDEFYDYCDREGILVWQDFPFANAMYPFGRGFRGRVRGEFLQQIVRLRNHPSLAIWCGNNEIEVAWKNWGWATEMGISESDSVKIWEQYQNFFQKYIPQTLKRLDGQRPYITSSPLSNWGKLENFSAGNMHYWGVWHGEDEFEDYKQYVPRFMSEYGWQSFPTWLTLAPYAPEGILKDKKYLDSDFLASRQKSSRNNAFLNEQIEARYDRARSLEGFLALSQLVQADAMDIAMQAHRDAYPRNMGTMYWQVNDAWPGASWSTIGYAGRTKAAYYTAKKWYDKRALATGIKGDSLVTYLYNDEVWDQGRIRWTLYDHKGGTVWMREKRVRLAFEGPRVKLTWPIEEELEKIDSKKNVLLVEWIEVGEETVQEVFHALPAADMKLKKAEFKHRMYKKGDEIFLEVSAKNYIKALEIQFEGLVVPISDNYFDLVPGQVKTVRMEAPRLVPEYLMDKVRFRSLVDWMK